VGTEGADAVAISPDGKTLYAANSTDNDADTITVVDLVTGRAGKRIGVGGLAGPIAMVPGGRVLYAVVGAELVRVDLPAGRVDGRLRFAHGLEGIAASPAGAEVFVLGRTPAGSMAVVPVDVSSGGEGKAIAVPGDSQDMAVSPNGRVLYVSTGYGKGPDEIIPFDIGTGKAEVPILFSGSVEDIALGPGGDTVYALVETPAACDLVAVDVVSRATRRLTSIECGQLEVSPDGRSLFDLGDPTLSWVNSATGKQEGSAVTGSFWSNSDTAPVDFVIAPDGRTAYVADAEQGVVVLPVPPSALRAEAFRLIGFGLLIF
jgi:DNA-binding beta-propeller fold protein YncE